MAQRFTTRGAEETRLLGSSLAQVASPDDVVSLSGDLGAGKTVFVKGMAEALQVAEPVTSPTFGLLSVHPGRMTLYHFDLYRLERAAQLEDIDFYETLEAGGVSAVEWGSRFPGELPDDRLDVELHVVDDETRAVRADATGPMSQRWLAGWTEAARAAGLRAGPE